ncbi:hypothetical protein HPB47_018649 [Ixodes persulcatus]|uniref:Uncharacterized protein n=1 Tax=Ixodes persulcatus TaxID=34615 RepID=A0AC60QK80_IXOPE|nr:hypothetical protein HPB47_018649 [Ixodes persulcatus]
MECVSISKVRASVSKEELSWCPHVDASHPGRPPEEPRPGRSRPRPPWSRHMALSLGRNSGCPPSSLSLKKGRELPEHRVGALSPWPPHPLNERGRFPGLSVPAGCLGCGCGAGPA